MNLRLILENVNPSFLMEFREKLEVQIEEYGREIKSLLVEQTGDDADVEKADYAVQNSTPFRARSYKTSIRLRNCAISFSSSKTATSRRIRRSRRRN